MTSSTRNPWLSIPTASAGQITRRRVNVNLPHPVYWTRDETAHPGLLIELPGAVSDSSLRDARINIRNISIDILRVPDTGNTSLVVKLVDEQNTDVFERLCEDLIEHLSGMTHPQNVFTTVCRRLKDWQLLLSGGSFGILQPAEVRGLYAELCFISQMLSANPAEEHLCIAGWLGPNNVQQDFIMGEVAVEVKSVSGTERGKVRISSEDQLHTHLAELYLMVYFLAESHDHQSAESLNMLVQRVRSQLNDRTSKQLFEEKLTIARYIRIKDYDSPLFRVSERITYLVTEGFPRITATDLRVGVRNVSYDLILASIEQYKVGAVDIFRK